MGLKTPFVSETNYLFSLTVRGLYNIITMYGFAEQRGLFAFFAAVNHGFRRRSKEVYTHERNNGYHQKEKFHQGI